MEPQYVELAHIDIINILLAMPQFIGTAATNGAIIIWNVNRDAKKQGRATF